LVFLIIYYETSLDTFVILSFSFRLILYKKVLIYFLFTSNLFIESGTALGILMFLRRVFSDRWNSQDGQGSGHTHTNLLLSPSLQGRQKFFVASKWSDSSTNQRLLGSLSRGRSRYIVLSFLYLFVQLIQIRLEYTIA
jgi:hypothetical protein